MLWNQYSDTLIQHTNTRCRFNVLDLLNHEYFSENIKIEVVLGSEQADVQSTESSSLRTMRMEVPNQYSNKKNGQESIEFQYDLNNDVPEHVVRDMVRMFS